MASMDDRPRDPRPPYPDAVGHPLTHTFRTMPDVLAFRDRALSDHDVARTHFFGPGDVYNLTHPAHLERALVDDRDAFRKSEDFRIAFDDGVDACALAVRALAAAGAPGPVPPRDRPPRRRSDAGRRGRLGDHRANRDGDAPAVPVRLPRYSESASGLDPEGESRKLYDASHRIDEYSCDVD